MKHLWKMLVLSGLISAGIISCTTGGRPGLTRHANGQLREQWSAITDSTGKRTEAGEYTSYYSSGAIFATGHYTESGKTGRWVTKFEDGQTMEVAHYQQGNRHGLFESFYTNQVRAHRGEFDRDYRNKDWQSWFDSGAPKTEALYVDGQLDGVLTLWYESGQKKSEVHYSQGVREGVFIAWWENGIRHLEGKYFEGEKNGTWIERDIIGQVVSEELYRSGVVQRRPAATADTESN